MEGDETALLAVKDSVSFFLVGNSVTYVHTFMPKDADRFQFVVDTDPQYSAVGDMEQKIYDKATLNDEWIWC